MRSRRDSRAVALRSYAKVNLFLKVLGRRGDGYHELDTVFQTIGLHDSIELTLGSAGGPGPSGARVETESSVQIELEVIGAGAPHDASNLAWKAATAYFRDSSWAGALGIRLIKRVPSAAGLGGGSANAAAVLRGLCSLCGPPESATLEALAAELGADVPFFLYGGLARASGRGDRIAPLPDLEPARLLVVSPHEPVPTRNVFSGLNQSSFATDRVPLRPPGSNQVRDWLLGNDLSGPVFGGYPKVREVYNRLQEFGLKEIQLSGSGGAMFTVFDQASELETIRKALSSVARVWMTTTVTRADATRVEEL